MLHLVCQFGIRNSLAYKVMSNANQYEDVKCHCLQRQGFVQVWHQNSFRPNKCPAFDKDKCLEPMFGDVGQARTNAAMLIMPIVTTSSRTCTKPTVGCRFSRLYKLSMQQSKYGFSLYTTAFLYSSGLVNGPCLCERISPVSRM